MNKTKRLVAIGLLGVGTSALSFGDIFQTIGSDAWGNTYNDSKALFSAVIEQGGYSVESGLSTGPVTPDSALSNSFTTAFSLTYDPTGLQTTAELTIGGVDVTVPALTVAPAGGTLDHIGIALSTNADGEAITISGLMLNGDSNGADLSTNGQGLFDFAMTPPTDLSAQKSVLNGEIEMSWTGNTIDPELYAEVVGADALGVTPEPGTWAMLGSALVGLGLLRRKRIV